MTANDNDRPVRPASTEVEAAIVRLLAKADAGRTISPMDAARKLVPPGSDWHPLMPAVRRAAVELARAGRLVIYRKGKPVDPENFKGVYRLGLPRQD